MTTIQRHSTLLPIAMLTLVALALRAAYWHAPPQTDETAAYLLYCTDRDRPIIDFISRYPLPNHHGLHGLAVVLLSKLTGAALPWIRLPAFLAGVLAVPLTCAATRLWLGRRSALIAAALMACSVWSIEYSINARGYTMAMCFVLIGLWCLGRANLGRPAWLNAGAGMALGAAAYTIHTTIYMTMAVSAWFAWRGVHATARRRRLRARGGNQSHQGTHVPGRNRVSREAWAIARPAIAFLGGVVATLVVLFAPIMARGEFGNVVGNDVVVSHSIREVWAALPVLMTEFARKAALGSLPAGILWGLVAWGAAMAMRRRNERAGLFILALAVIPPILFLQGVVPPPRALTFLLPIVYALAARGLLACYDGIRTKVRSLHQHVARWRPVAVLLILGCLSGHTLLRYSRLPEPRFESYEERRAGVDAVVRESSPDDVIFAQSWMNPLIRYRLRELGRPPRRVCRPRADVDRAVLYWRTPWAEDDDIRGQLSAYHWEEPVFDNGKIQIVRIARGDAAVDEPPDDIPSALSGGELLSAAERED